MIETLGLKAWNIKTKMLIFSKAKIDLPVALTTNIASSNLALPLKVIWFLSKIDLLQNLTTKTNKI